MYCLTCDSMAGRNLQHSKQKHIMTTHTFLALLETNQLITSVTKMESRHNIVEGYDPQRPPGVVEHAYLSILRSFSVNRRLDLSMLEHISRSVTDTHQCGLQQQQ